MIRPRIWTASFLTVLAASAFAERLANAATCPAFGYDTDCGTIITVTDNGLTIASTGQGPYDGNDDTLVGVVNNSSKSINALGLKSLNPIFAFDGDGVDRYGAPGNVDDTSGYGGPNAYFSNISPGYTEGVVNFVTAIASGSTSYFSLENAISSATSCQDVVNNAVATPTLSNGSTTIASSFTPNLNLDLASAARACGFGSFDWQEYVTVLPAPSPFAAVGAPLQKLTAPPQFIDPVKGGYTSCDDSGNCVDHPDNSFPFYLDPNSGQLASQENQTTNTLTFSNSPADGCLPGGKGLGCGGNTAPPGSAMGFATHLVGVNADGTATDLGIGFSWTSNFNGTSGGVSTTKSLSPVDPGSGTGGITVGSVQTTTSYQYQGLTVTTVNGMSTTNQPPVAICQNVTVSADATCHASVTAANVNNGSSDPDGDAITCTLSQTSAFTLGSTPVTLTCTDTAGLSNSCKATVTVADTTPPTLVPPPDTTVAICTDSAAIQVGQATATDNCASSLSPAGQVVASNNTTWTTPIPLTGGQAVLGIGTQVVRWTVSDGANPAVTAEETVLVNPAIATTKSFLVDNRAQVQNSAGGFGAVVNSGTGLTKIGNDARSGAILSVGPVDVLHRAIAAGNATSGGTVSKEADGTVTGTISSNVAVTIPAPPALPAIPAPTGGSVTVNSGAALTLAPGSYAAATVNGGTLILGAGDYFFASLTINSSSIVRAAATTRVIVADALVVNAPFYAPSGTAVQPIFLGFGGSDLGLYADFDGTLVAPNATVRFGTGSGLVFVGSFFGSVFEVNPASTLVCKAN